ncbi:aquaporin [Microbacterium sp. ASV81]|uniref:Aquaporin n=1 Tax=Microbacterium capsulatum TaxID=3041921 RepID=A0ABU0XJX7_9MICO|nr:aquaporin [Microbacterium sp. ASV81]MDQ4215406.1 aquaporin [Microbacterium sp. ASV81]
MSSTGTPSAPSVAPTAALPSRLVAEALGTFLLVAGAIGTALFSSAHFTDPGAQSAISVAVALAVGIAVLVGFYAFGPVSGGHFNPAVTLGAAAAGRIPWRDALPYVVAQAVGGVVASTVLTLIGTFGPDGWLARAQDAGFASNGWGTLSPGGFGMWAAIVAEVVFTALFLLVILGVTHPERGTPFAGVAIGLTLTLGVLATLPVDNASLNPARSLATAIYGGVGPLTQLWVFVVFPILGALIAGFTYRALFDAPARA